MAVIVVVLLVVVASTAGASVYALSSPAGLVQPAPIAQVSDAGQFVEHDWDVKYQVTRLEGISVYDVSYRGTRFLDDLRLPYIYVQYDAADYPPGSIYDKLGTENGTYRNDLRKVALSNGVELQASFEFFVFPRRGSYLYTQRYRFFDDGRMDLLIDIYGPGYGRSAHYDCLWLIRPAHQQALQSRFEEQRDVWTPVEREGRLTVGEDVDDEPRQAKWRYVQGERRVTIVPGQRDRADLYVGVWNPVRAPGEGSTTHPSQLVGNASVQNVPLALWYVAHQYANRDGCGPQSACVPGPALILESRPRLFQ